MPLVLVTGASGFLATHIIDQLLDVGYRVRGTVRPHKVESMRAAYSSYGDAFDAIGVGDFDTSDLTAAFKDVDALIHTATMLPSNHIAGSMIEYGLNCMKRLLEAASAVGVTKVVYTSSISTLFDAQDSWKDIVVNEDCWNPLTLEDALQPDAPQSTVWAVAKKLPEQALRSFALEHPDIDVVTILHPWAYGPHSPHQVNAAGSMKNGTNRYFYYQINGFGGQPFSDLAEQLSFMIPAFVHIWDLARAHVLALDTPKSTTPKRVIVVNGYMALKASVEHIATTRPELRRRLPDLGSTFRDTRSYITFDRSSAERILGMTTFKTWQETVEETIDSIVAIQDDAWDL